MFPPCKSVLYGAPLAAGRELRSDCYSEPAAIIGEERRGKASPEREIRTPRSRRVGHAAERNRHIHVMDGGSRGQPGAIAGLLMASTIAAAQTRPLKPLSISGVRGSIGLEYRGLWATLP